MNKHKSDTFGIVEGIAFFAVKLYLAGVQRMQSFVHGYRECHIPVRVKGSSLAQLVAFRHLILGITCA